MIQKTLVELRLSTRELLDCPTSVHCTGGKGAGHKGAGAKAWLCQMKIKSLPDALNYTYK